MRWNFHQIFGKFQVIHTDKLKEKIVASPMISFQRSLQKKFGNDHLILDRSIVIVYLIYIPKPGRV